MSWLFWIWITTILILTHGGAWDDYTEGRSIASIILSVVGGIVCIICVIAYSFNSFAMIIGKWLLPLSVFAGLQFLYGAISDVRNLKLDEELSLRANKIINVIGILFVSIVFGSAIIVGIVTGIKVF
jgi:hypothetical protein